MRFSGKGILLDIEGTTSSVRFVYDVMFPLVRRDLAAFLERQWDDAEVRLACEQMAHDASRTSLEVWCGADTIRQRETVQAEVLRLMDGDVKATGLKQLQGLIWRRGFESGELRAHLYPDVPACLRAWRGAGFDLRIYSSGSVQAQHLFFGHTEYGDLLSLFSGHYDTSVGAKREVSSYQKIAVDFELDAAEILFLSDVVAELDAALAAGMQTGLCLRPGNANVPPGHGHVEMESFLELEIENN